MKRYKLLNNFLGWIVFIIASIVFLSTVEPTASWWDCGEYISTAYKLQVGHPPGAPFFQLIGRFFSLFAMGDVHHVAIMVNRMSALCSGLTILFLFWSITHLARKLVITNGEYTNGKIFTILGAGLIGALAYTFTDSFWFSAEEGEVYAMSSFFTALVFWAMLKWEEVADSRHAYRWIILIAYLIGLSIGVHLLNLLAIPAIAFIYYFKKYKPSTKGIIKTLIISFLLLAFVMYIIIPEIVNLFAKTELLFVNTFHLPFNSGTIIFALVTIGLLVSGILYTIREEAGKSLKTVLVILSALFIIFIFTASTSAGNFVFRLVLVGLLFWLIYYIRHRKALLNTVILCFTFILIGYSTFLLIIIRANANTPINENAPKDAISLLSYLNREQYGTWPLVYGEYYNSPLDPEKPYKDGQPVYAKDPAKGRYVIVDDRKSTIPNYDSRFMTIFPRMWSNQKDSHITAYKQWGKVKGRPIPYTGRDGKTQIIDKPTFPENLRFFFRYQLGHMYFRYFMWNFVGRQNDIEGHGGIENGNWLSGIRFIDDSRLGNQEYLPADMENPARNKLYGLPLLLGLIGLFYHANKNYKDTLVVALLFIMTGIAIVVYLNQTPYQPRERDYSYAGSFYAFAMWIGLAVVALTDLVSRVMKRNIAAILVTLICLLAVPYIMARQEWNDHDRSGKYAARDYAADYLNSCAPNAVLITNGDNDTFPLWYAQEVEGIRTDVRVVNFMLASGDWYIHQMARKIYNSDPMPFTLSQEQYDKGSNQIIPYFEEKSIKGRVDLKLLIDFLASESQGTKVQLQNGEWIKYFPTKKVRLTVDSAQVLRDGIVPKRLANKIIPEIDWDIKTNYLYKNDLMLLDFLATNNWHRPIYFANPSTVSHIIDADQYMHLQGFVYRFMPVKAYDYIQDLGGILPDETYDVLMNKCAWGDLNNPKVYVDRESYRNSFIPKQNFMRLSQSLIDLNRPDSAVKATDRCLELFPNSKFHFDVYMLPFVDVYYRANQIEKANMLVDQLVKNYEQDIIYYNSQVGEFIKYFDNDKRQAFTVLNRLAQITEQYKQKELSDKINDIIDYQLKMVK